MDPASVPLDACGRRIHLSVLSGSRFFFVALTLPIFFSPPTIAPLLAWVTVAAVSYAGFAGFRVCLTRRNEIDSDKRSK